MPKILVSQHSKSTQIYIFYGIHFISSINKTILHSNNKEEIDVPFYNKNLLFYRHIKIAYEFSLLIRYSFSSNDNL
jgi:hypothetical protein